MFADVNADSVVSIADIDVIIDNWGETVTEGLSAGDVNLDGAVNEIDLGAVGNFLGFTFRRPPPSRNVGIVPGDFDGDFDADGNDFLIMQGGLEMDVRLAEWRTLLEYAEPTITSIPEPSASHLLPAALLTICRRRTASARRLRWHGSVEVSHQSAQRCAADSGRIVLGASTHYFFWHRSKRPHLCWLRPRSGERRLLAVLSNGC
jgi:hypothetical protein